MRGDAARREYWNERLAGEVPHGTLKVGIVWGGNKKPDPRRSASLAVLRSLAGVPDVALISLQKGEPAAELESAPCGMKVLDAARDIKDFADSAALLENLDLLITIDTAAAHLGGALGVRTWTMLPAVCDWRWLRDREDSPWYPTMKLFRQQTLNDWTPVVERIKRELERFARTRGATKR
jgi:ADP-heptose:LPS heptosyltransferase